MTRAVFILAATILAETGGEPGAGRVAVASVIVNRAHQDRRNPAEICRMPRQFSCWNGGPGAVRRRIAEARPAEWAHAVALAVSIEAGRFIPVGPWTHYYNPTLARPHWGRTLRERRTIGHHVFGVTE